MPSALRLRPRPLAELALLLALYVAYSGGRLLAGGPGQRGAALANARGLLHLEGVLHLDVERRLNSALDRVPDLALVASYWYAALHYVVTPAVLLWAYRRHARHYRRVRNALVAATSIGLVGFVLLPMAPPRMLPGFVDTLAGTARHGWWGADASAPKGLGGLTNELAAMPSLHVGWALWCAWVVWRCTRARPARLLAATYAVGTALVVVATGNHYVLDAVAGAAVVAAGVALSRIRVTAVAHRARRYLPPRASAADRCPGLGQGDPGGAAGRAVRDHAHLERRPAA